MVGNSENYHNNLQKIKTILLRKSFAISISNFQGRIILNKNKLPKIHQTLSVENIKFKGKYCNFGNLFSFLPFLAQNKQIYKCSPFNSIHNGKFVLNYLDCNNNNRYYDKKSFIILLFSFGCSFGKKWAKTN